MRRLSLSTVLVGVNLGALLVAVAVVAIVAVRLLGRFADDQALARVAQAAAVARREVNNEHRVVETTAQVLAERPTLRTLLQRGDVPALTQFLEQFARTSQLDGAAIWQDGKLIASSDAALPWDQLWATRGETTSRFMVPTAGDRPPLLAASIPVSQQPDSVVLATQQLDDAMLAQIGDRIGVPVTLAQRDQVANNADPLQKLHAQVTNEVAAARVDDVASYVAAVPLGAPGGEPVGVLETRLPTSDVAQSVQRLIGTLAVLTAGIGGVAALGNFLLGRRLARPLAHLTHAAARIGHGDLQSSIHLRAGHEIGTLAATLDDMRRRLLQLTTDLRHQQAEAQAILGGMDEGVFTVDRERRIRYLNGQAAALLGVNAADVLGRFCGDVLHPQGANGVRPCAEHCPIVHARFRGGARATEHLLINGQRRSVVITSAPAAGNGQQVQVLRDETDVEAVRRVRDAVLANVSHEFRTPLSAQLASIELLLDQLPDLTVEQTGDLIRSLQRGTLRLTQLIDNLLESARLEAGHVTIRQRPVALDAVVEDALELTRPLFDQRAQQVVVDLPYPLPNVCGDPPRLTQVFVNLFANANKFSPANSTIQIGGTVGANSVTLWVDDEGPGVGTSDGAAIWDQFVRAHAGDPEQHGVGLGLWLVRSIVERHGGTVAAHSLATGTRVSVTLPMEHA